MQTHELYIPMLLPLWGIFIGIALIVIGFTDKKPIFTYSGWSVLILTGLISTYFNLFQIHLASYSGNPQLSETASMLVSGGWLNAAGSALSLVCMVFYRFKSKRYTLLAVLTIFFYAIQFFQFYSLLQKPK